MDDDYYAGLQFDQLNSDQPEPEEYLELSDKDLRAECAKARDVKIISIRDWPHRLSPKQRYCLAVWCAKRDEREINRSFAK